MTKNNRELSYPRICAHRGFNTVAPENSMAAWGAAYALGADEIEFDLWSTSDGVIVSSHDPTLERVSDGQGLVYEKTYEELQNLDFGKKFNEKFTGLRIVKFEDILQKFGGLVIMNIHVKSLDDNYSEETMKKIVALVRKYNCEKHVYFMINHRGPAKMFKEYAPDIDICLGHLPSEPYTIVDKAIEIGVHKVQLWTTHLNKELIDKAHAHGIKCNLFYTDNPEDARKYLEMGIDTVLTNDYFPIAVATKDLR